VCAPFLYEKYPRKQASSGHETVLTIARRGDSPDIQVWHMGDKSGPVYKCRSTETPAGMGDVHDVSAWTADRVPSFEVNGS